MTTANDLCHTVAKHSFPFSFNSDTNQEFNDVDITESDWKMIDRNVALTTDQNVELATAIDVELTDKDLHNIDVDVAIEEAAAFDVTEGDMTRIDHL